MTMEKRVRTGGALVVEVLKAAGVTRVFCVPGESYLAVLDALYASGIAVTICRQEGGAAMMAEAWGKLTGQPGVCLVTRAPGATNAASGIHVASHDSTPLVVLVGQIETGFRERGAFQEIDYRQVFGGLAKWATEIDCAARIPELLGRAFTVATSGRPGPVVVGLPEDALLGTTEYGCVSPPAHVETLPGLTLMAELQKKLWAARAPVMILGGSCWTKAAVASVRRFAERFDLPVVCSFRRQGTFDHTHRNYAGDLGFGPNPMLIARLRAADLVLAVGTRLSEVPSQSYELFPVPETGRTLIHVHPDAGELGRVYRPTLAIQASPSGFAAALEGLQPPNQISWSEATWAAHADYVAWSKPPATNPGPVHLGPIMDYLNATLPADAIISNGAGNYAIWVHRFLKFRCPDGQLAPTSGSMGYGLPAAVAAKLCHPDRLVVAFAGDGCFQMTMQEFGTAVQAGAVVVVVVVDNGIYGTIRMHQERNYPGRVVGTDLVNPDFAALAEAYGGFGARVATTEEFAPAFEAAIASGRPAILHVKLDPEAISPTATITGLRTAARKH